MISNIENIYCSLHPNLLHVRWRSKVFSYFIF